MFRITSGVPKLLTKAPALKCTTRLFRTTDVVRCEESSVSQKPKRGFGTFLALVIGAGGGLVAYGLYDQDFRKLLEEKVPYAKEAFQTISSYTLEPKEVKKETPVRIAPIQESKPVIIEKPEVKTETPPAPAERQKTKKEIELERKKFEKEEAERRLREREASETRQNEQLEASLQNLLAATSSAVGSAITAANTASEMVKEHTKKLRHALEVSDAKEGEWEAVIGAHDERGEALLAYDSLSTRAKEELERFREIIEDGKKNKVTKKNKALYSAEEHINKMSRDFNSAMREVTRSKSDAKVFSDYRDLLSRGKKQFKKELESILPEAQKVIGTLSSLSVEELNALIVHAHKRVEQLQKQLAEQQSLEKLRMGEALERQKEEDATINLISLSQEKENWRNEVDLLKFQWELDSRVNFEEELKHHLKRQAAAHNDHIADVLMVQQRELEAKFTLLLSEEVEKERREFQRQVASWVARLRGIEEAIDKRAELEKEGHQIQKLWLACESFNMILNVGKLGATDWQSKLKPLEPEIDSIRKASAGQPAISVILDSVPQEAAQRGVWTESALIERFKKVSRVCKQVAMIDETTSIGGSLLKYALSYLQSKFVITGASKVYHDFDEEVNPEELGNIFVLLENAEACLNNGDFVQAVRFINQLTGEPKRAASDWLSEARLLLETKQIASALLASASAAGFTSAAGTS